MSAAPPSILCVRLVVNGHAVELAACAGDVCLQVVRQGPAGGLQQLVALRLAPHEVEAFTDALRGVACIAQEQAFELDYLTALAAAGVAPPPVLIEAAPRELEPWTAPELRELGKHRPGMVCDACEGFCLVPHMPGAHCSGGARDA